MSQPSRVPRAAAWLGGLRRLRFVAGAGGAAVLEQQVEQGISSRRKRPRLRVSAKPGFVMVNAEVEGVDRARNRSRWPSAS